MGRPSCRQEITPGGRGAARADQMSILSRCVSCLAIVLSSYRFVVRPVRARYETRAIRPLNFRACATAGQERPCSQYQPCRSKKTRCGVLRPSTCSSTRYRNCTVVFGPHLRIGSSDFTATRTVFTGFAPLCDVAFRAVARFFERPRLAFFVPFFLPVADLPRALRSPLTPVLFLTFATCS